MTSLPLFHLGIWLRVSDLEKRRGANLSSETVAGLVPCVASAECDVDLPPESLLSPQRSFMDLVAIRSADDEQVDVVGDGPDLPLIASCPRSVDHKLLDPADSSELFGDHEWRPERHQHQLRQWTHVWIGLIGRQQLRSAHCLDVDELDVLQTAHLGGDCLVRMPRSVCEFLNGPRA